MDYSNLLSSAINENEGIVNQAREAKEKIASAMEGTKDILDDVSGALVPTTLAWAKGLGFGPKQLGDIVKGGASKDTSNLSPAEGYSSVKDAIADGRIGELSTTQKLATTTEQDLTAASQTADKLTQLGESRLNMSVNDIFLSKPDEFLSNIEADSKTGLKYKSVIVRSFIFL